jgi:hypothetical protein
MKLACLSLLLAGCAVASAAPPDAGEPAHATLPPACAGLQYAHHLVRGRVSEAGSDGVRAHGRNSDVAWVVIETLELVWGDADEIDPRFQRGFYSAVTTGFCDAKHNCGFGARGVATEVKDRKGEELLFGVNLPLKRDRDDSGDASIPAKLVRRFGKKVPFAFGFCSVDGIPALLELKKGQPQRRPAAR